MKDRSKAKKVEAAILLLLVCSLAIAAASPRSAEAEVGLNLSPAVGISLAIDQITSPKLSADQFAYSDIQVTLLNTRHPTNVSILGTYFSQVAITSLTQFFSWSNDSGTLTSSQLSPLVIRNVTSTFPNESVNLDLFVGSNYSVGYPPLVTVPATYSVLNDTVQNLQESYLNQTSNVPARLPQFFITYSHVALIEITIGHLQDFKNLVQALADAPYFALGLAVVFLVVICVRRWRDVGPSDGDLITGLVTLLLFVPILILGINQLVNGAGSYYVETWLSQTDLAATAVFVAITVLSGIALAVSQVRPRTSGTRNSVASPT